MTTAVIALTPGGHRRAVDLAEKLSRDVTIYIFSKRQAADLPGTPFEDLAELWPMIFRQYSSVICVMALGIVVRTIAPHLGTKFTDPAVVVVDEQGRYAISVLSGHLGGANDLACQVAEVLGGEAVITTATDTLGSIAPDLLAFRLGFKVEPKENIRKINALLAQGDGLTIYSELDLTSRGYPFGELAPGVKILPLDQHLSADDAAAAVYITDRLLPEPTKPYLFLRPPSFCVGIGCRKGMSKEQILTAIVAVMTEKGLSTSSVASLASVDIKDEEPGLLAAAKELGVPINFFSVQQLTEVMEQVPGLERSDNVQQRIGVGGVCEPSALLGVNNGTLIITKSIRPGVTVAVARERFC